MHRAPPFPPKSRDPGPLSPNAALSEQCAIRVGAVEFVKYLQANSSRRGTSSICDGHWCMRRARRSTDGRIHLNPNCYDLKCLMGFISSWEGHVAHALPAHPDALTGWGKHPTTETPKLWHVMAGTWDGMDEIFRKKI
eukprot:2688006-Pyramimonas_sp.AAC.1